MKRIAIFSLMIICIDVHCQNYLSKGNEYFNSGQFLKADSLYSISICKFESHNVYFNRAIARLNLGDTCSACEDFAIMGDKYFDNESINYFYKFCCNKVDTNYFDKKYLRSDRNNYKYYEVIRWENCTNKTVGRLHKKNAVVSLISFDISCDRFGGFNENRTDIIAFFTVSDNQKIYDLIYNYDPFPKNRSDLNEIENRAKIFFEVKYPELKQKNNLDKLTINISFVINEDGAVSNPCFINTIPNISLGNRENEFKQDIVYIINRYPIFIPAKVKGIATKFLCKRVLTY